MASAPLGRFSRFRRVAVLKWYVTFPGARPTALIPYPFSLAREKGVSELSWEMKV